VKISDRKLLLEGAYSELGLCISDHDVLFI